MYRKSSDILTRKDGIRKYYAGVILSCFILPVFFVCFAAVTSTWAVSSVNVPLDHWSYGAIEKLDGFGLIHSDIQGMRPFTRIEMARLVKEALLQKEYASGEFPSIVEYLLSKLQREFQDEMGALKVGGNDHATTFIKPLEEIEARYVYSEGQPREFVGFPVRPNRIKATEGTPLVYNNDGVIYGEHHNFTLQFSSSMRLGNILSGYIEPILLVRENDGDVANIDDAELDILKGYGKISPWNIEFEAGRDNLWWGQGYHGSLILTDNAAPLDLMKLSNPVPFLLPWYFKYLGPFKYTVFISRLEEDREAPHALFGGIRFGFKPFPILEMGLNATAIFNGDGKPHINFSDFLDFIGFQGGESNKKFNQIAGLDFRLQLPFLRNAQVYGEYGGEDSGGLEYPEEFLFGDIGYLVGIYFPRLTCDGKTDLRFEYANNAHRVDSTPGYWYGNAVYRSGYTHNGMIMGHHMGPDSMDFFARATYYLTNDLKVGLDYDYMETGVTLSATEEKINQIGTDVTYDLTERISLFARYGFEKVENFNLLPGEDRENHLLMTTFKFDF